MVIQMKIGDRIRLIREQRGLTRQQLAERIDTSVGIIYFYEKNRKIPSAEILKRIAEALNVSADYLLGLTDDPRPRSGKFDPMEYLPKSVKDMITKTPEELRAIGKRLIEIANELEGKED